DPGPPDALGKLARALEGNTTLTSLELEHFQSRLHPGFNRDFNWDLNSRVGGGREGGAFRLGLNRDFNQGLNQGLSRRVGTGLGGGRGGGGRGGGGGGGGALGLRAVQGERAHTLLRDALFQMQRDPRIQTEGSENTNAEGAEGVHTRLQPIFECNIQHDIMTREFALLLVLQEFALLQLSRNLNSLSHDLQIQIPRNYFPHDLQIQIPR
ncbi:hypothetical protein T492DRAFT_1131912, partial [Pavlovales sp. CCMP2436]